jgi:hypothetical protein
MISKDERSKLFLTNTAIHASQRLKIQLLKLNASNTQQILVVEEYIEVPLGMSYRIKEVRVDYEVYYGDL